MGSGAMREFAKEYGIRAKHVVAALGVAALVGGALIAKSWNDRRFEKTAPGEFRGAHLVRLAGDVPALLVSSHIYVEHGDRLNDTSEANRLDSLDLRTGVSRTRVLLDEPTFCVAAAAGLAWCSSSLVDGEGVHLRDTSTLEVTVAHAKIVAAAPKLAHDPGLQVDTATHRAALATADGHFWVVDAALHGEVVDQRSGASDSVSSNAPATASSVQLAPGYVRFEGSPRAHMMRDDGRGTSTPIGAVTFIHPELVIDNDGQTRASPPPITGETGAVYFVVHDDTVDHGRSPQTISAIGLDGVVRWALPIGAGEVRGAWLVDGVLVLAVAPASEPGAILGIDAGSGTLRWRYAT